MTDFIFKENIDWPDTSENKVASEYLEMLIDMPNFERTKLFLGEWNEIMDGPGTQASERGQSLHCHPFKYRCFR